MSQTVRAITASLLPSTSRYSLANVTIGASTTQILSQSADMTTLYGKGRSTSQNVLRKSTDSGVTWTDVRTINGLGNNSEILQGVITLPSGEVLIATSGGSGVPGYIYRSTGWVANPTTATLTLTHTTRGGSFAAIWNFNQKCVNTSDPTDKVVFINTYSGGQTASSSTDAAQISKARYAMLSMDEGVTFNNVLDVYSQNPSYPTLGGVHQHAAYYFPAFDWLIVTCGDTTAGQTLVGAGNMLMFYSEDWRANPTAPTWKTMPIPTILANTTVQMTSILCTEDSIMFLADPPGQFGLIFPITGYRTLGEPRLMRQDRDIFSPYGKALERAKPGLPILIGHNQTSGYFAGGQSELRCSPDGHTFYPLWRDSSATTIRAFADVIFLTSANKVVAEYDGGIFRADLIAPTT